MPMKHVKVYRQSQYSYTAAVLCAIDGCDHLSCHGGPSHVVLVQKHIVNEEHYYGARARVYSSDTDAWGAASTSVVVHSPLHGMPSLLIGDALYFTPNGQWDTPGVLKYDMGSHVLSMIPTPGVPFGAIAMKAHDGGLGFVAMSGNCLYLMSQQATGGGWARLRTIELEMTTLPSKYPRRLFGYADGTDTIFVSTNAGLFTLNIMSRQVRKVAEIDGCYGVVPYTSFFTPAPSPPVLMEELIEEILIRLPPEEPAYLVHAALVCKAWRTMLFDRRHLPRAASSATTVSSTGHCPCSAT
ncbi:hypothetical protein U9M48_011519 [Paspalum notatum var. saurae]|uniref:F-box domain-containing protein n=1 Tax=Paspalum notatum var. saurae TaxID=547442 RepID=A0AAQ3SVX0_PASNO